MSKEKQTVTIQSTTKPDNPKTAIKHNNQWHAVIGNAAKYVNQLNPGDQVQIELDEHKQIVFIQKNNTSKNNVFSYSNRDKQITKSACFNMASRIVSQIPVSGVNAEKAVAKKIREQAEAIYWELQNFFKSETCEDGLQIPIEEVR